MESGKVDSKLGAEVHKVLKAAGVETPFLGGNYSEEAIKRAFTSVLYALNLDITDDSLSETPKRVAKMYINELFYGIDYNNFPKITTIENKMGYSSLLVERGIKVHSMCEHHFLPIIGEAFVAYLPSTKVIGLSKINRVVDFFCRRPQVQERLVEQIYYALAHVLETDDVAVMIRADHLCVKLRGVEDINSDTITTKLGGIFIENQTTRNEFYKMIEYGKVH